MFGLFPIYGLSGPLICFLYLLSQAKKRRTVRDILLGMKGPSVHPMEMFLIRHFKAKILMILWSVLTVEINNRVYV